MVELSPVKVYKFTLEAVCRIWFLSQQIYMLSLYGKWEIFSMYTLYFFLCRNAHIASMDQHWIILGLYWDCTVCDHPFRK